MKGGSITVILMTFGYCIIALVLLLQQTDGALTRKTQRMVNKANKNGPYVGLVIPNPSEMNPLLESPSFISTNFTIDFSGRRFQFGKVEGKKVILVMTGVGMLNAGITTQLLLSFFEIEGVVHYGIAGNANPLLHIGDVTIPQYWSHSALWAWQRYGDGPEDELPFEDSGDFTREIGHLQFGDYNKMGDKSYINLKTGGRIRKSLSSSNDNTLNNVWYQPEQVFPVDATPGESQHVFWVPVDSHYFQISKSLQHMKLQGCLNATACLSTQPIVTTVERGTSASIYLDNAAYRTFIYNKFNVSPIEMESAAVALACYQWKMPFIVIRALSDLAGGGSESNEAATFSSLAAHNSVAVVIEFIKNL